SRGASAASGAGEWRLAAAAPARHMERAEIVELHHAAKLDAPSGTAKLTAERMGGDVPIHSVRLPGLNAHQEVILGDAGQTLSIRHDAISREAYTPGVLLALEKLPSLPPGLTVGLDALLARAHTRGGARAARAAGGARGGVAERERRATRRDRAAA